MPEPTSILGFHSPRRRRKALLGVGVGVFGVFVFLIYLMASGPDEERAAAEIVAGAVAALPDGAMAVSDLEAAADALRRALALHPESAAAAEATGALVERIAGQVRRDLVQGDLEAAAELLAAAWERWPDHEAVSEQGELFAELRLAQEVHALIDEAEAVIAATGRAAGTGAIVEALELLRRSLQLDPQNAKAGALRDGMRDEVRAAAKNALDAGEAERAGRWLDIMDEEWGGDPELAASRRTLVGRLEELTRSVEVTRLLDLARRRLADDKLTTPATDSAAHYYRRVLQLDPDNEAARVGLERVGERYVALIRGAIDDSALNRARRLLRSLAELAPAHPAIPALSAEIEAAERAIAAAEERAAAIAEAAPAPSEAIPAPEPQPPPTDDEGQLWFEVKDSCVDAELRRYLESYPAGRYIEEAWRKISSCIESR